MPMETHIRKLFWLYDKPLQTKCTTDGIAGRYEFIEEAGGGSGKELTGEPARQKRRWRRGQETRYRR